LLLSVCFMCFSFYSSANLLRACFATLRPLPGLFCAPTASSFQCVLQCTGFVCTRSMFISLYFYCFFACNKSYLDRPAFGCDAWSKSLGYGCKHYPSFRVEEDKCWPEVLNPQCQGISVGLGFSAPSVKE
jgi:hypothetical protein